MCEGRQLFPDTWFLPPFEVDKGPVPPFRPYRRSAIDIGAD
jgi:hypothetical protein